MNCTRYITLVSIAVLLVSLIFVGSVSAEAKSQSLPDDATPLQRAIYEALDAATKADNPTPSAEYLSYGNGTTLTVLHYDNGTIRRFKETFKIETAKIVIDPEDAIVLPTNTLDREATEYLAKIQDILFGFTFEIPTYEWSIGIEGIAEGGITIDVGFGLRLPIQIELEYPKIMTTNRNYTLCVTVNGLDWTAADFANAGLQPNENEFLCKFYFRAWLWTILTGYLFDFEIDFDESRSFSTPIGSEETFPLPQIPIPLNPLIEFIIGIDLDPFVELTLILGPKLGSDKITADWKATNGAIGQGSLLWSHNIEQLKFEIQTQNLAAEACIRVTEFRYWFTVFKIDFILSVDFQGILDFLGEHEFLIYTLDLSDVIGSLDLSIGVHQCTIGTVYASVFVIPETLAGTLATIIAMVGALGLYGKRKTRAKDRKIHQIAGS